MNFNRMHVKQATKSKRGANSEDFPFSIVNENSAVLKRSVASN